MTLLPGIDGPLYIGSTDNATDYFPGALDDVRIYNRSLAQSEVQSDMVTSITGSSAVITTTTSAPTPTPTTTPATSSTTKYTLTRNLRLGMKGADVKTLQQFLNTHGYTIALSGPGSRGNETTYFGPATRNAVIKFQEAYRSELLAPIGLTKGSGFVGALTREKVGAF